MKALNIDLSLHTIVDLYSEIFKFEQTSSPLSLAVLNTCDMIIQYPPSSVPRLTNLTILSSSRGQCMQNP